MALKKGLKLWITLNQLKKILVVQKQNVDAVSKKRNFAKFQKSAALRIMKYARRALTLKGGDED